MSYCAFVIEGGETILDSIEGLFFTRLENFLLRKA